MLFKNFNTNPHKIKDFMQKKKPQNAIAYMRHSDKLI